MATYACRSDGTAANKAAATSTGAASTSMSMATLNSESFSDNDIIDISSRGGDFTTALTIPTGGSTAGNAVIYRGESGFEGTIDPSSGPCVIAQKDNFQLNDLTLEDAGDYGIDFRTGTYSGITTSNITITNAATLGIRHQGNITVTHDNLTIEDSATSIHGLGSGTITITSSSINDYTTAALGGTGGSCAWDISDSEFIAGTGGMFINNNAISSGAMTITNLEITDKGSTRGWDMRTKGALVMKNCIVLGGTSGDFYILPKTGGFNELYNNTFIGTGYVVSSHLIFNSTQGNAIWKNNNFIDVGNAMNVNSGTTDYNLFYLAGTVRGTNTVTTDPNLDATGRITSDSSSAYDAGVGPSTDSNVTTTDIDGNTRSGTTCDIGAHEFTASGTGNGYYYQRNQ